MRVIEVSAPMIEAQIPETFLVNSVNANTLFASKAARIVHAARGRNVYDFAARRTHGLDAADNFARVSYMVGFDGTSNLTAGARHGIPVVGTMAHSFVSERSTPFAATPALSLLRAPYLLTRMIP